MTHAEFEYELVEALNMLLEDERASVEMEVALASGATEYAEREALTFMGVEDIRFCEQLRSEMERSGLPVTPQINGVVFQVIGAERYDDRLRAFAHHQQAVADHARELQESNLDGALRDALEGIAETHDRHSDWTERRASEFAETRTLEFGATGRRSSAGALPNPDDSSPNSPDARYTAYHEPADAEAFAAPDELVAEPPVEVAEPIAGSVEEDPLAGVEPLIVPATEPAAPPVKVTKSSTAKAPAKAAGAAKATTAKAPAKAASAAKATTAKAPAKAASAKPATSPRRTRSASGEAETGKA